MKNLYSRCLVSFALVALMMLLSGFSNPVATAAINDDEPTNPLTIKDIMKQGHKQGLLKKVATEKATEAEVKTLHELYTKLAALTPTKGEQASWTAKTTALVDAALLAVNKDATFKAKLKAATNCSECHKLHK